MAYDQLMQTYLGVGLLAARPSAPNVKAGVGAFYYATDTGALHVWDGATWHTLAGGSGGDVVQLDYAASTDLANGTALSAATWTDVNANQSFSVDDASSLVEIEASGNVFGTNPASSGGIGARLVIDAAGTAIIKRLGGGFTSDASPWANVLAGAGVVTLTGLTAGSHTVKLQIYAEVAGAYWCRAASKPATESLALRVIERKP